MGSVFCLQTILLDDNVNTKFIYTSTALLCLFFISPTTPLSIGTLGLNHPPFGPRIKLNPSVDAQIKYFPFVHNNGSSDQISFVCNAPFSSSQQHYSLKYEKPPLFRIVAKCKPTTLLNSFPPVPASRHRLGYHLYRLLLLLPLGHKMLSVGAWQHSSHLHPSPAPSLTNAI